MSRLSKTEEKLRLGFGTMVTLSHVVVRVLATKRHSYLSVGLPEGEPVYMQSNGRHFVGRYVEDLVEPRGTSWPGVAVPDSYDVTSSILAMRCNPEPLSGFPLVRLRRIPYVAIGIVIGKVLKSEGSIHSAVTEDDASYFSPERTVRLYEVAVASQQKAMIMLAWPGDVKEL